LSYGESDASATQLLRTILRRSHDAVIRVYDDAGNVIETHEQAGEFKEW
jgi:hypothetical protein